MRHWQQDAAWVRDLYRDATTPQGQYEGICPADRQLFENWATHGVPNHRGTRDALADHLFRKLWDELKWHHAVYAEMDAKRLRFNPHHGSDQPTVQAEGDAS